MILRWHMSDLQIEQDHTKAMRLVRVLLGCLMIRRQNGSAPLDYVDHTKETNAVNQARAFLDRIDTTPDWKPNGEW